MVSADGPSRPVRFAVHRQPLCWNFLYHSRIVLSVGGSVWYLVRYLLCTVTIYSVLGNSKTQNAFLSPEPAMFLHDCPLAVKPANTPWWLLPEQTWRDSLSSDMQLSAVSILVVALRVRKFRRDLWITLYNTFCFSNKRILWKEHQYILQTVVTDVMECISQSIPEW
jgi:hypothetical protein